MPREIKAYDCEHGCGKFLKTLKAMQKHEATCLCNPVERTCKICGYDFVTDDDFECGKGVDKRGKKIIRHCQAWVERNTGDLA